MSTCGITKLINSVFAPSWKYKLLKNIPKNVGGLKKRAAKNRGKKIDSELIAFHISNKITNKMTLETKLILETFKKMNLIILDTQVMAKNNNLKTFIDLIVQDTLTLKKYVVEIKRGCAYRECTTKNGILLHQNKSTISNCLLHQHQLQALIGRWLLKSQSESDYGLFLIYVDEQDILVYDETMFVANLTEAGENAMIKAAQVKSKRKATFKIRANAKKVKK